MPNLSLLSILAVIIATYFSATLVIPILNKRGDQALSGVVDGIPVSLSTRRLILFTHYLPLYAFWATFVLVVGLGLLELARGMEEPRVVAVGYMGATMCIAGAVVGFGLGASWILHTWSVLRQAEAD